MRSTTLNMLHSLRDIDDSRLTSTHRLVLVMMLAFREGDGDQVRPERRGASSPSVRLLAKSTCLGESTVHRVRAQLRSWGYLTVRQEGHHHMATVFDIVLEMSTSETSQCETSLTEAEGSQSESLGVPHRESGVSQRDLLRISSGDHIADQIADQQTSALPPLPFVLVGDETKATTKAKSADVKLVFDGYLEHWRRVVGQGAEPLLTPKRRALIAKRLGEGFGVDRFLKAFANLFASSFHRGENDRGRPYLEIEQVIRASERVEHFERLTESKSKTNGSRGAIKQAPAPAALAPWRANA